MPFKSEAQKKKFAALVKEGKMKQETFDKWMIETTDDELPARAVGTKKTPLIRKPRQTKGTL